MESAPLSARVAAALIACLLVLTPAQACSSDLKSFVGKIIAFGPDGKIDIPKHINHIKIDIGLSYSAPMAQYWLSHEENLLVFGFEPNPNSVQSILQGAAKQHNSHATPLETKFIGQNFFLIPCALGISSKPTVPFFITKNDCGCSSLYMPKYFEVEQVIEIPIFALSDFFELFPFDSHPVIDYIKIDAQGADLDIVKSAKHYLAERVIYITIEPENAHYENTINSAQDIDNYMLSIGFIRYHSPDVADPTYFNPTFSDYIKNHTVQIYQKG